MSAETLVYPHLDCSRPGGPIIAGKNFKVRQLIPEHVAYGWSAQELALNHPQLTLGEVYAALGYYADHRAELDQELAVSEAESERMHREPTHTQLAARIKERTSIPRL
jgi:uncharacterized protein (DUF433 family)